MIITKPRDWSRIKRNLESIGAKRVFLMGCGQCATVAGTGGQKELLQAKARLEQDGLRGHRLGRRRGRLPSGGHQARDAQELRLGGRCRRGTGAHVRSRRADRGRQREQAGLPRARERVSRHGRATRCLRGALPDLRRLRTRPDRRHLSGHHVPQGAAQRAVRRDVGTASARCSRTASARTFASTAVLRSRDGRATSSLPPKDYSAKRGPGSLNMREQRKGGSS